MRTTAKISAPDTRDSALEGLRRANALELHTSYFTSLSNRRLIAELRSRGVQHPQLDRLDRELLNGLALVFQVATENGIELANIQLTAGEESDRG